MLKNKVWWCGLLVLLLVGLAGTVETQASESHEISDPQPILQAEEDAEWYLVRLPDERTGWVQSEHITDIGVRPLISQEKYYPAQVDTTELDLRAGPSEEDTALEQLPEGTRITVLMNQEQWQSADNLPEVLEEETAETILSSENNPAPHSLEGVTVAIDPGHGGSDPGAVSARGLQEKDVALQVSQKLKTHLESQGASVILTRNADYFVTLPQRVVTAQHQGADILVSVHANSHPDPNISGTETYYYAWGAPAQNSRQLGQEVQNEMISQSGLRNIGVKHGNFYVIRAPHIPSILVELGFLTNAQDENLLRQDDFLDEQARAIARGIVNYFN